MASGVAASKADILKLKSILSRAKNIVVLTGAGMSAESGIPTFRGPGGFWRTYKAQDVASIGTFQRNPSLVWEFYHYRRELVRTKQPNKGHIALAEAEARLKSVGRKLTVITQNIDGLHQKAGSKEVVELHGSLYKTLCLKCQSIEVNTDSPICPSLQGRGNSKLYGLSNYSQIRQMSTDTKKQDTKTDLPPIENETDSKSKKTEANSMRAKLKIAVRDYGSTVIVIHIGNSLILLGALYAAFSSGVDMTWLIEKVGLSGRSGEIASGASTFVMAYAVNKVLAPVRFSITFACTPFVVRYLRSVGLLKPPKAPPV
ncbi:hypothetical protein O3M35_005634 [Rhynocoris fuscipes]|uniref:Deacetylase sirtuin-type domain-containing protein n=1 Tax=Rhynocoris fuscipes TaxID=488301 RepID=A0AAW1DQZ2_9HEMI